MLGLADQTYNARLVWVFPGQSTKGANDRFRALMKTLGKIQSGFVLGGSI